MPNFSKAEPNSNKGQPKLFQQAELIQTPILVLAELNSNGGKCSFQFKMPRKCIVNIIYALVSVHENSVSESKPFQSRSGLGGKKD